VGINVLGNDYLTVMEWYGISIMISAMYFEAESTILIEDDN